MSVCWPQNAWMPCVMCVLCASPGLDSNRAPLPWPHLSSGPPEIRPFGPLVVPPTSIPWKSPLESTPHFAIQLTWCRRSSSAPRWKVAAKSNVPKRGEVAWLSTKRILCQCIVSKSWQKAVRVRLWIPLAGHGMWLETRERNHQRNSPFERGYAGNPDSEVHSNDSSGNQMMKLKYIF